MFWALLLKIQSAITPSILGVRGSSLDSRKLSPIPFNNTTVKTQKMKIQKKSRANRQYIGPVDQMLTRRPISWRELVQSLGSGLLPQRRTDGAHRSPTLLCSHLAFRERHGTKIAGRSGQLGSLPGHSPGFRRTVETSPFSLCLPSWLTLERGPWLFRGSTGAGRASVLAPSDHRWLRNPF